jgi:hypothetical protein
MRESADWQSRWLGCAPGRGLSPFHQKMTGWGAVRPIGVDAPYLPQGLGRDLELAGLPIEQTRWPQSCELFPPGSSLLWKSRRVSRSRGDTVWGALNSIVLRSAPLPIGRASERQRVPAGLGDEAREERARRRSRIPAEAAPRGVHKQILGSHDWCVRVWEPSPELDSVSRLHGIRFRTRHRCARFWGRQGRAIRRSTSQFFGVIRVGRQYSVPPANRDDPAV